MTDSRLTGGLPLFGAYIAPGEARSGTRLTAAELDKFNSAFWVHRIYDNGTIQVYDLSLLFGKHPPAEPRSPLGTTPASGTDVVVLILASVVATVWLFRLRRRARRTPIDAHLVVCGMVGAMAVGLFGTFAILIVGLPPRPIALLTLLVLLVLGLRPEGWRTPPDRNINRWAATPPYSWSRRQRPSGHRRQHDADRLTSSDPLLASPSEPSRPAHRARSQFLLGCAGLALFAAGASLATAAARSEWTPPPELSVNIGQVDKPVATVNLGGAVPISPHLEIVVGRRVLWSAALSPNSATQNVGIPAKVLHHPRTRLVLVAGGRTIRSVYG